MKHPIVLSGPLHSGKTYIAKAITKLLNAFPITVIHSATVELTPGRFKSLNEQKGILVIEEVISQQEVDQLLYLVDTTNVSLIITTQVNIQPSSRYSLIKCNYHG